MRVAHAALAFFLGAAIDAERRDGIVFGIGAALAAVEYIIRGHMQKRDVVLGGSTGQIFGRERIDRMCGVALALCFVNRGIGRAIDDRSRCRLIYKPQHRRCLCYVELLASDRDNGIVLPACLFG